MCSFIMEEYYMKYFKVKRGENTYLILRDIIKCGIDDVMFKDCLECYDLSYVLVIKHKNGKNSYWGKKDGSWIMFNNLQAYHKAFL